MRDTGQRERVVRVAGHAASEPRRACAREEGCGRASRHLASRRLGRLGARVLGAALAHDRGGPRARVARGGARAAGRTPRAAGARAARHRRGHARRRACAHRARMSRGNFGKFEYGPGVGEPGRISHRHRACARACRRRAADPRAPRGLSAPGGSRGARVGGDEPEVRVWVGSTGVSGARASRVRVVMPQPPSAREPRQWAEEACLSTQFGLGLIEAHHRTQVEVFTRQAQALLKAVATSTSAHSLLIDMLGRA